MSPYLACDMDANKTGRRLAARGTSASVLNQKEKSAACQSRQKP